MKDDAISRQAAIYVASGYCHPSNVAKELAKLPAVQPKRGKWIPVTNGRGGHECDQCHNYAPSYQNGKEHLSDFCPSCGTDMRTKDYEKAVEQLEHDALYEPTFNPDDGSM